MKYRIDFRNVDKGTRAKLRSLIEERIEHLEKRASSFSAKDLRLHGAVQKHGNKELYRVGLSIHLPGRVLGVEEEGENAAAVVTEAFSELERQVLRHKARIKHEHLWKRKARRRELHAGKAATGTDAAVGTAEGAQPSGWFEQIEPWLDGLYDFARHEITYLKDRGDLAGDDIQPDELVDSVVVAAWERQAERPESLDLRGWLYRVAVELLDDEVRDHAQRERSVSMEAVVSRGYDPNDDSIYEFYQPDELVRVEDLIGARDAEVEFQRHIPPVLAQLPRLWRRALLLHRLFDLPDDQVAAILDIERAALEAMLEHSAQFISAHLNERLPEQPTEPERLESVLKQLPLDGYPGSLYDELKRKFTG